MKKEKFKYVMDAAEVTTKWQGQVKPELKSGLNSLKHCVKW